MEIVRWENKNNKYFDKLCDWSYNWWGKQNNDSFEEVQSILEHSLCVGDRLPQTYIALIDGEVVGMYQIAMFDFNIACIRSDSYISIVLKKEDVTSRIEKSVIELEKKYVIGTKGEIYSTSDKEVPMIYAETGDAKSLDTYKFIKRIKVD